MPSSARYVINLTATTLLMAAVAIAQVQVPWGVPGRDQQAKQTVADWLTPKTLGMPRGQIAFKGRELLLFNGRGSVAVRDKSVTGLQQLLFPPISMRNYAFYLAFHDAATGTLIQDVMPDAYERAVVTGHGSNPLGFNFNPGTPFVMLLQRAYWEPNAYYRTGTFHKEIKGHWISFRIETNASVSAVADEIFLRVEFENREAAPLVLTVVPNQRDGLPPGMATVPPTPSRLATQPSFNTLEEKQTRISVVSDLPDHNKLGWHWVIAGHSKSTANFAIILQQLPATPPPVFQKGIAQREQAAAQSTRDRLQWAANHLPQVKTSDPAFDDLYRRCILSVLMTRWDRKNFVIRPYYAVGTWLSMVAWDTSYASEMLSLMDPAGLRKALLLYLRIGLFKYSYVPWNGKTHVYWYAQSPFAAMRILRDYLRQTGDTNFLNYPVEGSTVFGRMKQVGLELEKKFAQPDGLLDFGPGSQRILEIRTDGEQHIVAADNGMAVAYFRQMAAWCRARHDPDVVEFSQWAKKLDHAISQKLWDKKAGWFVNLYPDGSRHLVYSYHQFILLDTDTLSAEQQHLLVGHIREGEFLSHYGMYSISKSDLTHWDLEDVDWGGGGQYAGKPLRIAESLYRHRYAETAWDLLNRCTRWTNHFPYIPQEIFADFVGYPKVEMPLELSAGSGVQAILFGTFGLHPHVDGSLEVSPAYHQKLGVARMRGYKFRGHTYGVTMGPWEYAVYRDGKLAARHVYGEATTFPGP